MGTIPRTHIRNISIALVVMWIVGSAARGTLGLNTLVFAALIYGISYFAGRMVSSSERRKIQNIEDVEYLKERGRIRARRETQSNRRKHHRKRRRRHHR